MTVSADSRLLWVDTTVLSNLAVAGGVSFLGEVAGAPVTTNVVADEIENGVESGHDYLRCITEALGTQVPVLSVTGDDTLRELRGQLDPGEATCLRGAARRGGVVATDDAAARDVAKRRDIEVTGSIGLLAVGVRSDRIDTETANRWLERWQTERGYYSPVDLIETVLDS